MNTSINVAYKHTSNAYIAEQWLNALPDMFAADFETAIKYTAKQLEYFKYQRDNSPDPFVQIAAHSRLQATALDHPSHCALTHFSAAWSDSEAFVLVLDNPAITGILLDFLTTTLKKQIWHNLSYDAKHIMYHTGKFPPNYEDTQILAKTLLNHVDTYKANTGLKELAGGAYGAWGLSSEHFDLSHQHDPKVIKYAAIDAAATMWIWNRMQQYLKE